jgi:hypothetical protein
MIKDNLDMFSRWRKAPAGRPQGWHPSQGKGPRPGPLPGREASLPAVRIPEPEVDAADQTLARLDEAIGRASTYRTQRWIATTCLINPMLEVWEAAHAIHPAVSRPVEELLIVLVHRTTITPAEINRVVDEVRALALQASVLAARTPVK